MKRHTTSWCWTFSNAMSVNVCLSKTRGLAFRTVQTHADLDTWPFDLKQNWPPGLVMYYSPDKFGDDTSSGFFCFRVLKYTPAHIRKERLGRRARLLTKWYFMLALVAMTITSIHNKYYFAKSLEEAEDVKVRTLKVATLRLCRWSRGPTPDNRSSLVVPTVPAARITSDVASTTFCLPSCWKTTPAALWPSNRICKQHHSVHWPHSNPSWMLEQHV